MRPPTFVRALADDERQQLGAGLRSGDAFTLRRSQILLASAAGQKPSVIARNLGCSAGTVRNAIGAFVGEGLSSLQAKSDAPKQPFPIWSKDRDDELRALLHQSPRTFGKPRSTWTLQLVAETCHERGMTARQLRAFGRNDTEPWKNAGIPHSFRTLLASKPSAASWNGWGSTGSGPSSG
jgi:transposase